MTVLVTGGTGFLGHHVVHALRARSTPVRVLVRDRKRAGRLEAWGCEVVVGDVGDVTVLRAACTGVQSVVHLVSIIKGSQGDFERVMEHGTRNLVGAAEVAGVGRFVLASALGLDERSKDAVPYYTAKWEMERAVRSSSLDYVILRPSFVFGADGGVLPTFVRLARYAPVTPIAGSGDRRLQPIWVEDAGEAFARAVDGPDAAGKVLELGGPEALTWDEFWSRLKRVLGKRRPSVHVPIGLLRAQAALTEKLPGAPVTRDQLTMLELGDNVCTGARAADVMQLSLVPVDEQLRRAVT
jgi:NADH dehydrogenase